ncbi:hypothetical protein CSUB01_01335 [Colletotrichum sublineola]|uniref:Uncharacterized protein n=1 Tax=Colletotrichum sublineola TaxID=1173701 RepID=A0A066X5P2_COLSU|nr:hypothetical protein CSUB01_01335 [Colletotrichum sublineola]
MPASNSLPGLGGYDDRPWHQRHHARSSAVIGASAGPNFCNCAGTRDSPALVGFFSVMVWWWWWWWNQEMATRIGVPLGSRKKHQPAQLPSVLAATCFWRGFENNMWERIQVGWLADDNRTETATYLPKAVGSRMRHKGTMEGIADD